MGKNILAINPGTKYLGIAVFEDSDLRDWGIKVIPGKWTKSKMIKIQAVITDLIFQYHPDTIALKSIHPSRRSGNLNALLSEIRNIAKRKGIGIEEYSIEDLKSFYSPEEKINKRQMAELIAARYPVLSHELDRELKILLDERTKTIKEKRLRKYYSRMFEAVALGYILTSYEKA